jgi:actin-related protein
MSLPELIKGTIDQCDKDIKGELFSNIVTCGGTSNLMNFGSTL